MSTMMFKPKFDKTMGALLVILMLIIGMSIGGYIYQSKLAHGESYNLGKITIGTIAGTPKLIGITLSQTCITLVKSNSTDDDCPSYKDLIKYDNTNQFISGKFVTTNGFFHRANMASSSNNNFHHYQMYGSNKTLIMIDPDQPSMVYGQTITIVPHGLVWVSTVDPIKNNIRTQYHDRSVSSDCKTAKVTNKNFLFGNRTISLLNDTIAYLESGCKITSFNNTQTIVMKETPADYKHCVICAYKDWLKKVKTESSKNCINYKCAIPDTRWK